MTGDGRWSVRTLLIGQVFACLLPGIVAAVALFLYEYREGRAQLEKGSIQTARALMLAVDQQILRAQSLAQGLAMNDALADGELAKFHGQARQALGIAGVGHHLVLADREGHQLLNTAVGFGTPLPGHGNLEAIRQVFATGRPVVSDLYLGTLVRHHLMSVSVPVVMGGKIAYSLSIAILTDTFNALLAAQKLPPDWVGAVFDSTGTIVGRTREPERWVGSKPVPELLERMGASDEGTVPIVLVDGTPVVAAYSRSPATGWRVGIGIPRRILAAEPFERLSLPLAGIASLLVVSLALAWSLGERISRAFRALIGPAAALGAGDTVLLPKAEVKEAAEVARALARASRLLQERTAALAVERESRQQLLAQQVEERTAELARANEALVKSNIELRNFTHAAAHDLQTPLRSIVGFAQFLERDVKGRLSDLEAEWLGYIIGNTKRLQKVIQDLLVYARLDGEARPYEETNLSLLVEDVLTSLSIAISETGARVECAELPVLCIERVQMAQVFQNLLENALKYRSPERPPWIRVTGERQGDDWVFAVADNGIGIEPRHQKRIFEVFRRLHTYTAIPGTGIGLAICQRVVERHGGRIWVESRPGEGSVFRFSLPVGAERCQECGGVQAGIPGRPDIPPTSPA